MNANLNQQVGRLGFWSGVIFLVTVVVSLVLPLDVPDGLLAFDEAPPDEDTNES